MVGGLVEVTAPSDCQIGSMAPRLSNRLCPYLLVVRPDVRTQSIEYVGK